MKKLFGTKGQGAMEYLMTYGWAILVVMIVGIVMWQLGIFNMGGTTVTATGFAKIKPQLAGSGLSRDGQFTGVFTNGVGTRITMTSSPASISGAVLTNPCRASFIGTAGFTASPHAVGAGQNFLLTSAAAGCTMGAAGTVDAGTVYDITLSLVYNVDIGGVATTHTETGTFRGPAE